MRHALDYYSQTMGVDMAVPLHSMAAATAAATDTAHLKPQPAESHAASPRSHARTRPKEYDFLFAQHLQTPIMHILQIMQVMRIMQMAMQLFNRSAHSPGPFLVPSAWCMCGWLLVCLLLGVLGGPQGGCLLYTSPSPRDKRQSRMPSSA